MRNGNRGSGYEFKKPKLEYESLALLGLQEHNRGAAPDETLVEVVAEILRCFERDDDWRTVSGIAREIGKPASEVLNVVNEYPEIFTHAPIKPAGEDVIEITPNLISRFTHNVTPYDQHANV